jgi:hypothetical protein
MFVDPRTSHGFIAYIDEAGDDGLGKFRSVGSPGQSLWLCLSATIVAAENDRHIPIWRDEMLDAMPKRKQRHIHFDDFGHEQRVMCCKILSEKPIGIISILSNKTTISEEKDIKTFSKKNHLYKYLLRYVSERVSEYCKRKCLATQSVPRKAKIVFSRRGGMDYTDFQEYMFKLRALQKERASWHQVHWDYIDIDSIDIQDHTKLAGLQLADIAASAFHKAVEPNYYGIIEPRYAEELRDRVIKSPSGSWLNAGIKPIPNIADMDLSTDQLKFLMSWKQDRQAPGS